MAHFNPIKCFEPKKLRTYLIISSKNHSSYDMCINIIKIYRDRTGQNYCCLCFFQQVFAFSYKCLVFNRVKIVPRDNFIMFLSALVAKFAEEQIKPYVMEMDQNSEMKDEIIKGLFDLGVCLFHSCDIVLYWT